MPNVVQILRSNTPGARPVGRAEGEIYINFADLMLGVVDASGTPIDLLDLTGYLPLAGGMMTGPIEFGNINERWRLAFSGGYFSISSLVGGVELDKIVLDPLFIYLRVSTRLYDPNGGAVSLWIDAQPGFTKWIIGRSIDGATGSQRFRWVIEPGDITPEIGGNAGSDFAIHRYADAGNTTDRLGAPLHIRRSDGLVTLERLPSIPGGAPGSTIVTDGAGVLTWAKGGGGNPLILDGVGATPFVDPTLPGDNSSLVLNKPPTGANDIVGAMNGSTRWTVTLGNDAPEAGGDQGSDFAISRWDDTGKHLGPAIKIARQTGVVDFDQPPTIAGAPMGEDFLPLEDGGRLRGNTAILGFGAAYTWRWTGVNVAHLEHRFYTGETYPAILFSIGSVLLAAPPTNPFTMYLRTDINKALTIVSNKQNTAGQSFTRWAVALGDSTPETGGNVGSDFSIVAYSDTTLARSPDLEEGHVKPADPLAALFTPLHISRATGKTTLSTMPSIPGGLPGEVIATDGAGTLTWSPPTDLSGHLPLAAGPTMPLTGELHLAGDPTVPLGATPKQYVDIADSVLQDQIALLAQAMLFIGSIDVVNDVGTYTVFSGFTNGPLPAAAPANKGFYVIVSGGGTAAAGNIPPGDYTEGDWIVSDGAVWLAMPVGQSTIIAPNVALSPVVSGWDDVQEAIEGLQSGYLPLIGGEMSGAIGFTSTTFNWRLQPDPARDAFSIGYMAAGVFKPTVSSGDFTLFVYTDLSLKFPTPDITLDATTPDCARTITGRYAGTLRWQIMLGDATSETGGNAGSDFSITAFSDTTTFAEGGEPLATLSTPLHISRATGLVTIPNITLDMGRF